MVLILTGAVQSGKTRFLAETFAGTGPGVSGYLSPAVYEHGRLVGYDLAVFGRERAVPFLRTRGQSAWERVGPYFFIPDALADARRTIRRSPASDLLVVDELGPREIDGGGVWSALRAVMADPGRRLLLVVRPACLEAVLARLAGRRLGVFPLAQPGARASLQAELGRGRAAAGAGREGPPLT